MPAIQRSEFSLALNQVAAERGVDPVVVLDTVKNAILAAYRKDHPGVEIEEYSATLDKNTGEARIFKGEEDVTPPGFGRIAAQTAKQVILQKIREKEKEAILTDYKVRIGTIVNGMILRFAGPNIIIDIGKAEGVMPPSEQISNEKYHLNQRLTVHLLEIREGPKGEEIIVSRTSTGLLEGLFKREVPEISQGAVVIKAIAREAGNRSKIAVASNQSGIDPVGSCVGQKGVRVQAVIQEFNGAEKIDIIQWQENTKAYIAAALSPAKELLVEVNEEDKVAIVKAASEDLPLAIGKEGQNVRLASKLTGYRIEIAGRDGEMEEIEDDSASAESSTEPKEEHKEKKVKTTRVSKESSEDESAEAEQTKAETDTEAVQQEEKTDEDEAKAANVEEPNISEEEEMKAQSDQAIEEMNQEESDKSKESENKETTENE